LAQALALVDIFFKAGASAVRPRPRAGRRRVERAMQWVSGLFGQAGPPSGTTLPSSAPSRLPPASFVPGELVEYYSDSQRTWVPARVVKVEPGGTYGLDCKANVTVDKIRKPPSSATSASSAAYAIEEIVEYFSSTEGKYIPAKVLKVNPNGTYDLDCKPSVPTSRIRRREKSISVLPLGEVSSGSTAFALGEIVEYFSASQGDWIPAKVLQEKSRGIYDLDCKPNVPMDKLRKRIGPGTSRRSGNDAGAGPVAPTLLASCRASKALSALEPVEPLKAPVQLLKVTKCGTKWLYEVCPDGAKALEGHGSRRIAVASICGLHGTGKSYLLNLLLERVQKGLPLFQVGSTTNACTEGLWLWGSVDQSDEHSPLLAFVDCEGFGRSGSDKSRDAQLMTLCTLLSSVLILNTKGALDESIFNALALVCRFAEHIEDHGNEAGRPTLLWVLRDFMLELRDKNGHSMTPDEYLDQALHTVTTTGNDTERGPGRREVRQSLVRFFNRRSCATLAQPAADEKKLDQLQTIPYASLRTDFCAGVEALRAQLFATCRSSPKTLGGQAIGCSGFVALLRQVVQIINEDQVLNVRGAWETVQHTACGCLVDSLRCTASSKLRAFGAGEPLKPDGPRLALTEEKLRLALEEFRSELKSTWDTRAVGDEAVRREYWQELEDSLGREESVVRQQNARLADAQLMEALKPWQAWLDSDVGTWADGERVARDLGQALERMPAGPLSRSARVAIETAGRRVAAVRTALAAATAHSAAVTDANAKLGDMHAQRTDGFRIELDESRTELQRAQDMLTQAIHAEQTAKLELESQTAELTDAKAQLQDLIVDIEAASVREHELKSQLRIQGETEDSLRAELESSRVTVAKADGDQVRSAAAADSAIAELRRLEAELEQSRAHHNLLSAEIEELQTSSADRSHLSAELEEAQRVLEAQRVGHETALEAERKRLAVREHFFEEASLEAQRVLDAERVEHAAALEAERNRNADGASDETVVANDETVADQMTSMRKQAEENAMHAESARKELTQVQEQHAKAMQAEQKALADMEAQSLELQEVKMRLQAALADVESSRQHGQNMESRHLALSAKAEAERVAAEECSRATIDAATTEQRRLRTELEQVNTQVTRLEAELEQARAQLGSMREIQAQLEHARGQAADKETIAAELAQARAENEEWRHKLEAERATLKGENEKTREEHVKMVEETWRRLEEERKTHAEIREAEKVRILDGERNAGFLEGRVVALTTQAEGLQGNIANLTEKLKDAECEKVQDLEEKDELRRQLEQEKVDGEDRLRTQAEDYENRLQEEMGKRPKCACTVQ